VKIITLASGSKANSTYIESGETRLIFDFGLSCKATVSRLEEIGIMPMSLSGRENGLRKIFRIQVETNAKMAFLSIDDRS